MCIHQTSFFNDSSQCIESNACPRFATLLVACIPPLLFADDLYVCVCVCVCVCAHTQ